MMSNQFKQVFILFHIWWTKLLFHIIDFHFDIKLMKLFFVTKVHFMNVVFCFTVLDLLHIDDDINIVFQFINGKWVLIKNLP